MSAFLGPNYYERSPSPERRGGFFGNFDPIEMLFGRHNAIVNAVGNLAKLGLDDEVKAMMQGSPNMNTVANTQEQLAAVEGTSSRQGLGQLAPRSDTNEVMIDDPRTLTEADAKLLVDQAYAKQSAQQASLVSPEEIALLKSSRDLANHA